MLGIGWRISNGDACECWKTVGNDCKWLDSIGWRWCVGKLWPDGAGWWCAREQQQHIRLRFWKEGMMEIKLLKRNNQAASQCRSIAFIVLKLVIRTLSKFRQIALLKGALTRHSAGCLQMVAAGHRMDCNASPSVHNAVWVKANPAKQLAIQGVSIFQTVFSALHSRCSPWAIRLDRCLLILSL